MKKFIDYKKEISLIDIVQIEGYSQNTTWAREKRTNKYLCFENQNNDRLIIKQNDLTQNLLYFNPGNSEDKGDLITFLERKLKLTTPDKINQYLENCLSINGNIIDNTIKNSVPQKQNIPFKAQDYLFSPLTENELTYLESRGIAKETIESSIFEDIFKSVRIPQYDKNGNILKHSRKSYLSMPYKQNLYGSLNLSGIEYKDTNTKRFAIGTDKSNSLGFTEYMHGKTDAIFITESWLDAVSHYQLTYLSNKNEKEIYPLYIITGGTLTLGQLRLIHEAKYDVENNIPNASPKTTILFDDDIAGMYYEFQLLAFEANFYQSKDIIDVAQDNNSIVVKISCEEGQEDKFDLLTLKLLRIYLSNNDGYPNMTEQIDPKAVSFTLSKKDEKEVKTFLESFNQAVNQTYFLSNPICSIKPKSFLKPTENNLAIKDWNDLLMKTVEEKKFHAPISMTVTEKDIQLPIPREMKKKDTHEEESFSIREDVLAHLISVGEIPGDALYDTPEKRINSLSKKGHVLTFLDASSYGWKGPAAQLIIEELIQYDNGKVCLNGLNNKKTPDFNNINELIKAVNWDEMERMHGNPYKAGLDKVIKTIDIKEHNTNETIANEILPVIEINTIKGDVTIPIKVDGNEMDVKYISEYKNKKIVKIDGNIHVYDPKNETLFNVALNDSNGRKTINQSANNLETANQYIDWADKTHFENIKPISIKEHTTDMLENTNGIDYDSNPLFNNHENAFTEALLDHLENMEPTTKLLEDKDIIVHFKSGNGESFVTYITDLAFNELDYNQYSNWVLFREEMDDRFSHAIRVNDHGESDRYGAIILEGYNKPDIYLDKETDKYYHKAEELKRKYASPRLYEILITAQDLSEPVIRTIKDRFQVNTVTEDQAREIARELWVSLNPEKNISITSINIDNHNNLLNNQNPIPMENQQSNAVENLLKNLGLLTYFEQIKDDFNNWKEDPKQTGKKDFKIENVSFRRTGLIREATAEIKALDTRANTDITLHFNKSKEDVCYLNDYTVKLYNTMAQGMKGQLKESTFRASKEKDSTIRPFTVKEAVNLLDGRSVLIEGNNWAKLNLDDNQKSTVTGNYFLNQQTFDLERGLTEFTKLKINADTNFDELKDSLKKGNLSFVKGEMDGKEIAVFIAPEAQYKTFNIVNSDLTRHYTQEEKESLKKIDEHKKQEQQTPAQEEKNGLNP